jgi:branched-chain amino acid transport system permease protein
LTSLEVDPIGEERTLPALFDALARRRPSRGTTIFGPLGSGISVLVVGLIVLTVLGGNYYDTIFILAVCFAIVVVGMVVQVGYSHQLAFHQSVFMMLGAYGVAVLNTKYHWAVPVAMVVMVIAAAIVGGLIGALVTRTPGFALALATLFFSVIVGGYVTYNNYLGGSTGLGGVAAIWTRSKFSSTLEYSGGVGIVLLALSIYLCARILKSGIGLELALLGQNERMADSIGIISSRRKLELFILGSALSALGGAVFAGTQAFVSPGNFDETAEVLILIMLFIGGRSAIFGGLIGAVGIEYLQGSNNWVASNLLVIEGVLFTLVLLYAPDGVIGLLDRGAKMLMRPISRAQQLGAGDKDDSANFDTNLAGLVNLFSAPSGEDGPGLSTPAIDGEAAPPEIECRGLTKRFSGVVAVNAVTLTIRGTGIHAVCGPNGAGKSTFFELVSGGLRSDDGHVFVRGVDVTKMPAFERAELGVCRTLQAVRLMNNRTVLDNVAVAALPSHRTFMLHAIFRSDLKGAYSRARDVIEHLGISHLTYLKPGQLTLENQRMVELARALVARPKILLLDEPASGLSIPQRSHLAKTLLELSKHVCIVLVEHDLELVARIASDIFVLIDGSLAFEGDSQDFLESPVVRSDLMGLLEGEQLLGAAAQPEGAS